MYIICSVETEEEFFEFTDAIKEYEAYEEEIARKAAILLDVFPEKSENERKIIARQNSNPVENNPLLKNPKKYRMILREEFSRKVQYDIPAEILSKYKLRKEGTELRQLTVADWITNDTDNAGIVAKYLNFLLSNKYGKRDKWTIADYEYASEELPELTSYIKKLIESVLR